eukprot:TRINITY_DN3735_c1_g2_i1.p1 TRINITY_DN3735_c1_g2~~TRINITY_DN3735_c1_g2_i1.p1  ORF type:complete len:654 (+),score=81.36 TRINITY_DN3735_c1_g2_i1:210-2171(+)
MRSAAIRQREHVERLSQPASRRKTVFVQPYSSCGDSGDYITIGIPQDMTQLHQVLEKIHAAVGYKLITPVVGLYRFKDRTRIHSVREIQNNERLIYVCQGEVQMSHVYYTSSQSSEGSQQQQFLRGGIPSVVVRQNSGSTSTSYMMQRSGYDNTVGRQKSIELDLDTSMVIPQIISNGKDSAKFHGRRASPQVRQQLLPTTRSQSSRGLRNEFPRVPQQPQAMEDEEEAQEEILPLPRAESPFDSRALRQFKSMPRHQDQEEQLEFNTTQSVVSGQVSIAGGIPPRRAMSYNHTKSLSDYSENYLEAEPQAAPPLRRQSEPRRRRGKSQTEMAMSSDNFSFDIQVQDEDEDLSSTPTYGSSGPSMSQRAKADSLISTNQRMRGETARSWSFSDLSYRKNWGQIQDDRDIMALDYRSSDPKFVEGADFDGYNSQQQIEEGSNYFVSQKVNQLRYGDQSHGIGRESLRLSPILEPADSPRLMPAISEGGMPLPKNGYSEEVSQMGDLRPEDRHLSLTLKDIQQAAHKEIEKLHQQEKKQLQDAKRSVSEGKQIEGQESLEQIMRMIEQVGESNAEDGSTSQAYVPHEPNRSHLPPRFEFDSSDSDEEQSQSNRQSQYSSREFAFNKDYYEEKDIEFAIQRVQETFSKKSSQNVGT